MDFYKNSSITSNIVGYGSQSVVIAHRDHNHHNDRVHFYSPLPPPTSMPKTTPNYRIMTVEPVAPTPIYVLTQPQKEQRSERSYIECVHFQFLRYFLL